MGVRVHSFQDWKEIFEARINGECMDADDRESQISLAIDWIKNNADGQWMYPCPGIFWFENEYDAVGFKLVWS